MNKKGFTTVELILTLAIVIVIMTTIISVTFNYRDQGSYEQTITEINNYKNNLTKIIYDDILDIREEGEASRGKVVKIEKLDPEDNTKYKLITNIEENTYYLLEIIDRNVTKNGKSVRELGIRYDGIEYIIPGSENNFIEYYNDTELQSGEGNDSNIYLLDIHFYHKKISYKFKIHLLVLT